VVDIINKANNRNTVMPMAPVMDAFTYREMFINTDRVYKSHEHMIVAMEYQPHVDHFRYGGVMHEYTWPRHHCTGRPQVVSPIDNWLGQMVGRFGPLINTSFNFHGLPIAFDMESVIRNHMLQQQQARLNPFTTVVIQND
jgi:predicted NodU family carbamoyl transferase